MGRKRQRSRVTSTDDDELLESAQYHVAKPLAEDSGNETAERKKEVEIWDAFKEEHHEVLEQLPLSLHRQFKLMRELDTQSEVFQADLLASVRRYICLRETLSACVQGSYTEGAQTDAAVADVRRMAVDQPGETATQTHTLDPSHGSLPAPHQPNPRKATRSLLQHIAQTSEEAIRTAEEKVSIAQTAYETVDRHIRLLDQAIKEQEAAISLGVRPGTHLAPILLPDLVVPRWARPPRVEHSPVPSLSPEPELYVQESPVVKRLPPPQSSPKAPKKGKKAATPKSTKLVNEKEEVHPSTIVSGEEPKTAPRTRRAAVRLTMTAHPQTPVPTVPADPSEKRYCYCNQVSFGTMIACDNEGCKLEWFHLGCTGLSGVPSKRAEWYCRECKSKVTQKGRSKTRDQVRQHQE